MAEPLLGLLPRPAIRWAESHLWPASFSDTDPLPPTGFKVAFVRQALWPNHPTLPAGTPYRDLITSTEKLTGLMALFSEWNADPMMVGEDPAPECTIWQEAFAGNPNPEQAQKARREAVCRFPPGRIKSVDDVDWGSYHLVISANLSVPTRIVEKCRQTVWAYFFEETGTPSYRASWQAPLAGYDLFINGLYRRFRTRPKPKRHVIEMSYNFQRPRSYDPFRSAQTRQGILLEKQTAVHLTEKQRHDLESWGPVWSIQKSANHLIQALVSSKYYLQFGGNTVWGNGMIEAAVAGCLAVSEPRVMPNNSSLLLPGLNPRTWPEVISVLEKLEGNPNLFETLQNRQQNLAEWLSFIRPARDLLSAVRRIRQGRGLPCLG